MIKPNRLHKGDKVATISLSSGMEDKRFSSYLFGKEQIEKHFGLKVIETTHALRSKQWIYENPKARAEDLMEAFSDSSIKAIISITGGADSIRILPYIDKQIINTFPKIFLGFSDSTIAHHCCFRAGLVSFYGPSIFSGFSEPMGMFAYQIENIKQVLFSSKPIGRIKPNDTGWTSDKIDYDNSECLSIRRKLYLPCNWKLLQGQGIFEGQLIGGCLQVLELLKGTEFWYEKSDWEGSILFIEISGTLIEPFYFLSILRNYAANGVFSKLKGVIFGRPVNNQFLEEYENILLKVIRDEQQIKDIPILSRMNFGHTYPVFTIPYGIRARINCEDISLEFLESATI